MFNNSNSVNWSSEAVTIAVFKRYEDNGSIIKVYIDNQDDPIKCTSNHAGDYQLAVKLVKDLRSGEDITYYSRGVNVYSSKEWFYKIERNQ